MKNRVFTVEEANKLISRLRPLLQHLAAKKKKMVSLHDQLLTLELIQEARDDFYETHEGKEYLEHSANLEDIVVSFEADLKEIADFGCIVRDIEKGVVDFYHVAFGGLVFLNWCMNEDEIAYWHELDKSYLERLPLSQLNQTREK